MSQDGNENKIWGMEYKIEDQEILGFDKSCKFSFMVMILS